MTQPAFGRDLSCLQDEDAVQSEVNGYTALAQALARRLQTPRGTLIGDSAYGYHVIGEIDNDVDPADIARIATNIDAEFVKDQRVLSSYTSATFSAGVLVTQSTINTTTGPWKLTLAISDIIAVLGLGPQGGGVIVSPPQPWNPRSARVPPRMWLRADLGLATTPAVAVWPDQSGNGNDMVQAASANRPAYGLGPRADLPGVVFTSASTQFLEFGDILIPIQDFTIGIIAKVTSTGSAQAIFSNGSGTTGWMLGVDNNGTGNRDFNANGVTTVDDGAATTSWEAWVFSSDPAGNLSLIVNGIAKALSPSSAVAITGGLFSSIGSLSGSTRNLNGSVFEVIVYPSMLGHEDIVSLVAYQSSVTGIF